MRERGGLMGKDEEGDCCHNGYCHKCKAGKLIVGGLILIGATVYAPQISIWIVIGALLIVKGIGSFIMPHCSHCK